MGARSHGRKLQILPEPSARHAQRVPGTEREPGYDPLERYRSRYEAGRQREREEECTYQHTRRGEQPQPGDQTVSEHSDGVRDAIGSTSGKRRTLRVRSRSGRFDSQQGSVGRVHEKVEHPIRADADVADSHPQVVQEPLFDQSAGPVGSQPAEESPLQ